MIKESNFYKSVSLYPYAHSDDFAGYVKGKDYGYFLIEGKLVPFSLVDRIENCLSEFVFEYDDVWSVDELLGKELWSSLDEFEQSVAADCVLIILENGYIPAGNDNN